MTNQGALIVNPDNEESFFSFIVLGFSAFAGDVVVTGNLNNYSDRRFKQNIEPLGEDASVLSDLLKLEPVKYQFKKEKFGMVDLTQSEHGDQIGFIAQDLKKVYPELVSEDQEGYMSVNYVGIIPALVEGVKEQQQTIDSLNAKIAELEKKFENANVAE